MPRTGRPTDYSLDLAERICDAVATHGSVAKAVKREKWMPTRKSVWRWARRHEEFGPLLARAREVAAHVHAEEGLRDLKRATKSSDPVEVRALGQLADFRKWLAGVFNRAAYAPNPAIALQVNAGDGSSLTFASVLQSGAQASPPTPQCSLDASLEAGSSPPLPLVSGEVHASAPDSKSQDPDESDSQDADAKENE